MKTATKIKPEKWYSLQDIVKKKMFAWSSPSFWSVRNVVALDRRNKNILQAVIVGSGRATKYKFKGENIINFIKTSEKGSAKLG